MVFISGAVEGGVDEAVLRRLIEHVGATPGPLHIKGGKAKVLERINGYNMAARISPWVVLVDLDGDECAPQLLSEVLPRPESLMRLRVAVPEIEAWLLADRTGLANFIGVPQSELPSDPDALQHPKELVVTLASRSRKADIKYDLVPRPQGGRSVGPAYSSRLAEFVSYRWNLQKAATRSDSLNRAVASITALADAVRGRK